MYFFSRQYLENDTPSRKDGLSAREEQKKWRTTCDMIAMAGKELKLPQWTIARATIDCHRFYAVKSPKSNSRFLVSTASLFLAAKADDCPRALADVLVVSWRAWNRNRNKEDRDKLQEPNNAPFLAELRDLVLTAERSILYCRGFNMEVPHPFMSLMDVLKKKDLWPANLTPEQAATPKKDVLQRCWSMVNDSLPTTLPLQYDPSLMAKAIIYVVCSLLKVEVVSDGETFAERFEIDPEKLREISAQLLAMYKQQPTADDFPELMAIAARRAPAAGGAPGEPEAAPAAEVLVEDVPQALVDDVPQALVEDVPQVLAEAPQALPKPHVVGFKAEEASIEETGIKQEKQRVHFEQCAQAVLSGGAASRKRKADVPVSRDIPVCKVLKSGGN